MTYENESCRINLPNGYLPGMYEGLAALGIHTEGGVSGEFASDHVVAQAFINAYTPQMALDYVKAAKSLEVSLHAKMLRDRVVRTISPGEMASWPIKLSEAVKFAATGDAAQCPMLSAEAAARGVTLAQLVAKVGGNGQSFSGIESAIGGIDGKHRDAIKALTVVDDVAAYDFTTGWPAV